MEETKRIVKDAYAEELLHQPVALALLIAVSRTDLPFVEFFVEQGLTGHWPGVSIAFHVHVGGGGSNREISRIFNYTPVLCVFGETSAVRV